MRRRDDCEDALAQDGSAEMDCKQHGIGCSIDYGRRMSSLLQEIMGITERHA